MDWTAVSARSKIRHVTNIVVRHLTVAGLLVFSLSVAATGVQVLGQPPAGTALVLPAPLLKTMAGAPPALAVDGLFVETAQGRTTLPPELTQPPPPGASSWTNRATLADGRVVSLSIGRQGDRMTLSLTAQPATGVIRWGLSIHAARDEYFTGLMERVVDGPQRASWAPGITEAMNLRGQKVDLLVKPTLSVYAPFYLSSRGYSVTVGGTWPGHFDFAATNPERVAIDVEGPSLSMVINTASTPAELVRAHALEAGPPFLPPRWLYSPCRWRDEHTQRTTYYAGTSPYAVFWGGDIGGTQEGLRASIIGVQRSAVMGYPNWGSDTCGYNQQLLEQEVCARWLAFSAFTPIMEVGPTRNVGFWNLPRAPEYDDVLIATWRLYARLHERLRNYSYAQAVAATKTGMPIVRPLFLADPDAPQAWSQWWTYLYGPDLLVSPVWQKGQRSQEVYLPAGSAWRNAWTSDVVQGGRSVTVPAEPHQIPIFVRVGSALELGDLAREWMDAQRVARERPDLKALEADVTRWFAARAGK